VPYFQFYFKEKFHYIYIEEVGHVGSKTSVTGKIFYKRKSNFYLMYSFQLFQKKKGLLICVFTKYLPAFSLVKSIERTKCN
jgi:hypothetical protein